VLKTAQDEAIEELVIDIDETLLEAEREHSSYEDIHDI
jgi:hypothetical protein